MKLKRHLIGSAIFLSMGQTTLDANPAGASVVMGTANISSSGNILNVVTGSNRTVINWDSFSIGSGDLARFVQPGANSAVLNRVIGTMPSEIAGRLVSNGRVALLNSNGVFVTSSGVIDTRGFIASTLDIDDQDFLNGGTMHFKGTSENGVRNAGTIVAREGDVFLLGKTVSNSGTIRAENVSLAAGSAVMLKKAGDGRISVEVPASDKSGKVSNTGSIQAVQQRLRASGGNPYALAMNVDPSVEATPESFFHGQAVLTSGGGSTDVAGSIKAGSAVHGGRIDVAGGKVDVQSGAKIDASGRHGGGSIRIGGGLQGGDADMVNAETTRIALDAAISADARITGQGGSLIVYADQSAVILGDLSAKGARGANGGFIETSGKEHLVVTQTPDAGVGGSWLIDPNNIEIVAGSGNTKINAANPFVSTDDTSQLGVGLIVGALTGGANVTVTTGTGGADAQLGNITVSAPLNYNGKGTNTLTLSAHNDIIINAAILDSDAGTVDALNLNLTANSDGLGGGGITINNPVNLTSGNLVASGSSFSLGALVTANTLDLTGIASGSTLSLANLSVVNLQAGASAGDTLNGNAGSQTVNITGANAGNVGALNFTGIDIINAGGGADTLNNTSGTAYLAQTNKVAGIQIQNDGPNLSFETIETPTLNLTTGDDVFTVTGTKAGQLAGLAGVSFTGLTTVAALGHTTADTINLPSGPFTVDGGATGKGFGIDFSGIEAVNGAAGGSDTLINTSALVFQGTTNKVGPTGISVSGFETIQTAALDLSADPDAFTVTAANKGTFKGLDFTGLSKVDALGGSDTLTNTSGLVYAAETNKVAGIEALSFENVSTPSLSLTIGGDIFSPSGLNTAVFKGVNYSNLSVVDALGGSDTVNTSGVPELTGIAKELITQGITVKDVETLAGTVTELKGSASSDTVIVNAFRAGTANGISFNGIQTMDLADSSDFVETNAVVTLGTVNERAITHGITISDFENLGGANTVINAPDGANARDEIYNITNTKEGDVNGISFTGISTIDAKGGIDTVVSNQVISYPNKNLKTAVTQGVTISNIENGKSPSVSASDDDDVLVLTSSKTGTLNDVAITVGTGLIDLKGHVIGDKVETNAVTVLTGNLNEVATHDVTVQNLEFLTNTTGTGVVNGSINAEIFTMTGPNQFTISGVGFSGITTINAGGGNDVFNANANLAGGFNFDGNGGDDQVSIGIDQDATGSLSFTAEKIELGSFALKASSNILLKVTDPTVPPPNSLTVNAPISAGGSVTVTSPGEFITTATGDIVAKGGFLRDGGGKSNLSGDISADSNLIRFTNDVALTGPVVINAGSGVGGSISFDAAVTGPFSLVANGGGLTEFKGSVDIGSLLTDAAGTSKSVGVKTSGTTIFNDDTTLSGTYENTGFTAAKSTTLAGATTILAGAGPVAFTGAVNGGFSLESKTTGLTTFGAAVGSGPALASLKVVGASSLASNVTTTTTQEYGGLVTLTGNSVLTGTTLTLTGGLNGGTNDLTLDFSTPFTLPGGISNVDDFISKKAINVNGTFTTLGNQTYEGAVTLLGSSTLASSGVAKNIQFDSTVTGALFSLEVNTGGLTDFKGLVNVASLRTDAAGTSSSVGVTTTGVTEFNDDTTISGTYGNGGFKAGKSTTLAGDTKITSTGAGIAFDGTLNSDGATPRDLTLDAGAGIITFGNSIGNVRPLGDLIINSASTAQVGGNAAIDGDFSFTGGALTISQLLDVGGKVTITNAGLFTTLAAGDILADGGFLQNGAGANSLAGDITTISKDVIFTSAATLAGNVLVNTGADAGNVEFLSTLNGTAPGAQSLGITAGTGNITFTGAVGGAIRLGAITLTSANTVTANAISATSLTQVAGSGQTTLNGKVNTDGLDGVSLTGAALQVNDSITTTGGGGVTVNQTGTARFAAAGDIISDGKVSITADGGIITAGDITTTGDDVTFSSAVTLDGGVLIDTGAALGGNVLFSKTVDGGHNLGITAGLGDVTFTAPVGGGTRLGALTISSAASVTAGAITSASLTQLAGSVLTTLNGPVNTNAAAGVSLTGAALQVNSGITTTGGGGVTVNQLVGKAVFEAAADIDSDGAVSLTAIGGIRTAGDIKTTNDNVTYGSPVTLTGGILIDTGAGGGSVVFTNTLDGSKAGQETLGITAGTGNIRFDGAVGGTTPLGAVTVTSANDVTAAAFAAASFTQSAGEGITTLNGVTDLTGNFSFTGKDLTVNQALNVAGTTLVTNKGLFTTAPAGDITATGGFTQNGAGSNKLSGDIATSGKNLTFATAIELAGSVVLGTGPLGGDIFLGGTVNGSQDLTVNAGSGDITFNDDVGGVTRVGALQIVSAADVTAKAITATSLSQLDGIGLTKLDGAIDTSGLAGVSLTGNNLQVNSKINTTGGGGVVFNHKGTVMIDSVADILSQGDVSITGTKGITTAGNITTNGRNVTFASATNLSGDVLISTGTGAGNVLFSSTLDGSKAGGQTVGITAGTGDIAFVGAVGGGTRLGAITLTSANDVNAAAIFASSLTQLAGFGTTTLNGKVDTNAPAGISLKGSNLVVHSPLKTSGGGTVTVNQTGTATFRPGGDIESDGAVAITAGGGIFTEADVTTTGDAVTFASALNLNGGVRILTAGGNVRFDSTIDGRNPLTINAGGGDITFKGAIGSAGGGINPLGSITIVSAKDVAAQQSINASSFTQRAGTGTTTLNGRVDLIGRFSFTGNNLTVNQAIFTGGLATITNAGTFKTAAAGDISAGAGITQNGAGANEFAGDLITLGNNITIRSQVRLTGDVLVDTGATLAGNISFQGNVLGNQSLNLEAGSGNIRFAGAVGDPAVGPLDDLNVLRILSANNAIFEGSLAAASFVQDGGIGTTSLLGAVDLTGDFTFTGQNLSIQNTVNSGGIFTVTNAGLFSTTAAGDIVATSGFEQNGTGRNSLAGDLTTVNSDISFAGAVSLAGRVAMSTDTGGGNITFGSTLNGARDLTLTAGTGDIAFNGVVGAASRLGVIRINSAKDVNAIAITSQGLVQDAGTGTTSLNGTVNTNKGVGVNLNTNDLVIGAGVTANNGVIRLGAASSLTLKANSPLRSGLQTSLLAGADISINSNVTAGRSLDIESTNGHITMSRGAVARAETNIRSKAGADTIVGRFQAGQNVSIESVGDILDAQGDLVGHDADGFATLRGASRSVNVVAKGLHMKAGGDIGTAANPFDISVSTVALDAGDSAWLLSSGPLVVGAPAAVSVQRVGTDSSTTALQGLDLEGGKADEHFKLETLRGALTVSKAITATGGDLQLAAGSPSGDSEGLNINARATSGRHTTLISRTGIDMLGSANAGGTLDIEAFGGSVTMGAAASAVAGGDIRVRAVGNDESNITLGRIETATAASVEASNDILDAQRDVVKADELATLSPARTVNAKASDLQLKAGGSIGTELNPVDIEAVRLAIEAGSDANVFETNGVTVAAPAVANVNRVALDSTVTPDQFGVELNGIQTPVFRLTAGRNITQAEGSVLANSTSTFLESINGDISLPGLNDLTQLQIANGVRVAVRDQSPDGSLGSDEFASLVVYGKNRFTGDGFVIVTDDGLSFAGETVNSRGQTVPPSTITGTQDGANVVLVAGQRPGSPGISEFNRRVVNDPSLDGVETNLYVFSNTAQTNGSPEGSRFEQLGRIKNLRFNFGFRNEDGTPGSTEADISVDELLAQFGDADSLDTFSDLKGDTAILFGNAPFIDLNISDIAELAKDFLKTVLKEGDPEVAEFQPEGREGLVFEPDALMFGPYLTTGYEYLIYTSPSLADDDIRKKLFPLFIDYVKDANGNWVMKDLLE